MNKKLWWLTNIGMQIKRKRVPFHNNPYTVVEEELRIIVHC